MSEEKKCCGCCANNDKELNNEQLEKVTGGGWVNGKFICLNPKKYPDSVCENYNTVDGVPNVCTCVKKTNGICCKEFKDNCSCERWNKNTHRCRNWTE